MAIIISSQSMVDDYFESEDVNQSSLKDLAGGLDAFLAAIAKKKKDKEENKPTPDYFLIGGGVDTILTGEEGEFEKQYYVSTLEKKPSEAEIQIIGSVFDELAGNNVVDQVNFEDCYDAILAAADEFGWQRNWKAETRVKKIVEKGTEYFEDLKSSLGMKILTSEMRQRIDNVVTSLKNNPRTKKYFDRELQAEQENMDFYYQLPIYFTYEGVDCKALMDLVVVHKDNDGNIIKIEPIDLKTMSGNTLQFNSKIKQHRYDIQAAWYVHALQQHFGCSEDKIMPFKFIVESTTNLGTPLVFEITEETLAHGQLGSGILTIQDQVSGRALYYPAVKGYKQLMADYIYYSNQGFQEDKVLENNPGIIKIDYLKGIV